MESHHWICLIEFTKLYNIFGLNRFVLGRIAFQMNKTKTEILTRNEYQTPQYCKADKIAISLNGSWIKSKYRPETFLVIFIPPKSTDETYSNMKYSARLIPCSLWHSQYNFPNYFHDTISKTWNQPYFSKIVLGRRCFLVDPMSVLYSRVGQKR